MFNLLCIVGLNDRKTLNLSCSMFLPTFELSKVLFAGKIKEEKFNVTKIYRIWSCDISEGSEDQVDAQIRAVQDRPQGGSLRLLL